MKDEGITMSTSQNQPDPSEVNATVEKVRTTLFARLGRPARPLSFRPGIAVVVAVALFGSGIGIGTAAAYASTGGSPVPGTTGPAVAPTSGPSEFTFRIDCYMGPDAADASNSSPYIQLGYNNVTDPTGVLLTAAAANPAAACQSKSEQIARIDAYIKATTREPMSTVCMTITMPGIAPYYLWTTWSDPADFHKSPSTPWEKRPASYTQENHLSTGTYLKPSGYPNGCAQLTLATPSVSHQKLAACVADPTRASVFVIKDGETVSDTCTSHDNKSWTS
jgi:hypothetical protein